MVFAGTSATVSEADTTISLTTGGEGDSEAAIADGVVSAAGAEDGNHVITSDF